MPFAHRYRPQLRSADPSVISPATYRALNTCPPLRQTIEEQRAGLLECIKRDADTLRLPRWMQEPGPAFFRKRLAMYRRDYAQLKGACR